MLMQAISRPLLAERLSARECSPLQYVHAAEDRTDAGLCGQTHCVVMHHVRLPQDLKTNEYVAAKFIQRGAKVIDLMQIVACQLLQR